MSKRQTPKQIPWSEECLQHLQRIELVLESGVSAESYMATTGEVAAMLGVKPSQIRNALSMKKLPIPFQKHARSVRFKLSEVLKYKESIGG